MKATKMTAAEREAKETAKRSINLTRTVIYADHKAEVQASKDKKNMRIACLRALSALSFSTAPKLADNIKKAKTIYCTAYGMDESLFSNREIQCRLKMFIKAESNTLRGDLFDAMLAVLKD